VLPNASRDRDRKVPRRDQAHHADRLARHFDTDAGPHRCDRLAADAQCLAGEELEDVARAHDLAGRLGQGLAFLARQQVAELALARQDLAAGRVEDVEALLRRRHAPAGKRRARRGDRRARLLGVGLRVLADHVARVRGIDVARDARTVDPLAVDQVLEHARLLVASLNARAPGVWG
jgi:hypothetical protein